MWILLGTVGLTILMLEAISSYEGTLAKFIGHLFVRLLLFTVFFVIVHAIAVAVV